MDTDTSKFDSTDDYQPADGPGSKSLTDEEVKRLGLLHEEFTERTRNAVSDSERNTVQDDIQKRLVQKGNPWADVWAHAAAYGHSRHDAKYRVMLDWFNNWVKKAKQIASSRTCNHSAPAVSARSFEHTTTSRRDLLR